LGAKSVRERRRSALVLALTRLTPDMIAYLHERKTVGRRLRQRDDLVWHLLLQSFATMGNSRGWPGLFETPGLAEQVSFSSLRRCPASGRRLRLEMVLRKAKVRMAARKAEWLAVNFQSIEKAGGVRVVTRHALSLGTREAKYRFMDEFKGIGPKYARNVWMDIYDPLFRDAVAIDERIKSITTALGYSFKTYDEHEAFYRQIAQDARLEPWEMDRLLYRFKDHFLIAIDGAAASYGSPPNKGADF
jgi:hypothetical protein